MLDVAPDVERAVREYAAREGISIEELLARTFPLTAAPTSKALDLVKAIRGWQAEDVSEDEEELARRDEERVDLKTNLDRYRREGGMRPLFPETK